MAAEYRNTDCPNCDRHRVQSDGVCEKCLWDSDGGNYASITRPTEYDQYGRLPKRAENDPFADVNPEQHVFVREQFTKWVEETDVAEQCGLTRKEMIDSVEFNEPSKADRPQIEIIREDQTQLSEKRVSDDIWRDNVQHHMG